MTQISTRVKLRNAFNLLKVDQHKERELIERIIQDTKGKDVSLDKIIEKLEEKKTELLTKKKQINSVIHQIKKQNEKPPKNTYKPIESGDQTNSQEPGDKKLTEGLSSETSIKD